MTSDERTSLMRITRGLMVSENLGDVHDEINFLHDLLGLARPKGDFLDGWTDDDCLAVGMEPDGDGEW